MKIRHLLVLAAFLTSTVTGCGGGASGSGAVTPSGGGAASQPSQTQTEDAISSTEAVGTPTQDFANFNDSTSSPLQSIAIQPQSAAAPAANGTCSNGVKFYAPDKNGDPNSTETQFFYDNACAGLARDVVRIWTSTGTNSENVQRSTKMYGLNIPIAYSTG